MPVCYAGNINNSARDRAVLDSVRRASACDVTVCQSAPMDNVYEFSWFVVLAHK